MPRPRDPSSPAPVPTPAVPFPAAVRAAEPLPPERARSLFAGSPREILARIVPGDPLRLRPRVAEGVRRRAVLVDADRVHLRALALAARRAERWRGRSTLEAWLGARVDEAIDQLLEEGPEAAALPAPPQAGVFDLLAAPLGLDPPALHRACARFNRLPDAVRRAFFRLVLEGRGLDELARAESVSATELARRARRGLDIFVAPDPSCSPASEVLP